jgi:hypothetical protein
VSAGPITTLIECSLEVAEAESQPSGASSGTLVVTQLQESHDQQSDAEPARHDAAPPPPPLVALAPRQHFYFENSKVSLPAVLQIENRSNLVARYDITVEGVPEDWISLSTKEPRVEPGGRIQVSLNISPKTRRDYPAGDHSFRIRVANYRFADSFSSVDGSLTVQGQASFDARLSPMAITGRSATFNLALTNTGDVAVTIALDASDIAGICEFDFEPIISLTPWEERVIPITVRAQRNNLVGPPTMTHVQVQVTPRDPGSLPPRLLAGRFLHKPFVTRTVALAAFALGPLLFATAAIAQDGLPWDSDGDGSQNSQQREVGGDTPTPTPTWTLTPSPTASTTPTATATLTPTASPSPTPTPQPGQSRTYTVRPGDTLASICAQVKPTMSPGECISQMVALNNLSSTSNLAVGQVLRIP